MYLRASRCVCVCECVRVCARVRVRACCGFVCPITRNARWETWFLTGKLNGGSHDYKRVGMSGLHMLKMKWDFPVDTTTRTNTHTHTIAHVAPTRTHEKFSIWMQTCWIIMISFYRWQFFLLVCLSVQVCVCERESVYVCCSFLLVVVSVVAVTSIKCNQKKIYKRHEWNISIICCTQIVLQHTHTQSHWHTHTHAFLPQLSPLPAAAHKNSFDGIYGTFSSGLIQHSTHMNMHREPTLPAILMCPGNV